jgi:uncharacterized protein with NAD-binding domain and iron-sulfur cluster
MTNGIRRPQKIAIIGGGVGAITAAFAMTEAEDWQSKYEITLYQLGWRLGGKGASGRNMDKSGRIEEHGLHVWAGFYDNAFRAMRLCYAELARRGLRNPDAPLGTIEAAFKPLNHFFLSEEIDGPAGSDWRPWMVTFPGNSAVPGSGGTLPSPFAYFRKMVEFLVMQYETHETALNIPASREAQAKLARSGAGSAALTPIHHLRYFAQTMPDSARNHTARDYNILLEILEGVRIWLDGLKPGTQIDDDTARRVYFMLDLGTAFAVGMVADRVFLRGFDAIDDMECSAWLLRHDASEQAVSSVVFRGCYDYVFGYPGGLCDHRGVGAGTAMRGLLRLAFTYKGALFFKMQAGMGDTIFAPYYQVLQARGVQFRFFHAVTNLSVSESKAVIDRIDVVEQAQVRSGPYDPLCVVADLPCWPSQPAWSQLVDGEELKASGIDFECEKEVPKGNAKSLHLGTDFDAVILGASLGSLPYMTAELAVASPRWRQMLANVQTVATCAAQFWLSVPATATGWPELVEAHNDAEKLDPPTFQTVMTGFSEPLDTWADMSHLLARETWPDPPPASIAYFCSPSKDANADLPSMQDQVGRWADEHLVRIWPKTLNAQGEFDRNLLVALNGGSGSERFAEQYFRQNFYGSERYVLSVPGSVGYRLAPDQSGFSNLALAGDWTLCGINAGCVEAATISGLAAARMFTGSVEPIYGEGDLAPDEGPKAAALLSSIMAPQADWPLTPAFLRGAMDGVFSFHALPCDALTAMLPKGLVLARQRLTPAGTHPVTFLFNRQMGVRLSFMPQLFGFRDYLESIFAINFVEIDGGDGTLFSFLPALLLNSSLATWSGKYFYGLAKRLARSEMTDDSYRTSSETGEPIWKVDFFEHASPGFLADLGDLKLVRTLLETPIVTPRGNGGWQAMAFDFGVASAFATPAATQIDIYPSNNIGLPAGRLISRPYKAEPSKDHLPGSFRCWTNWTLSNPFDSDRVKRIAGLQQQFQFIQPQS